ncbi:hypothetical protein [Comamonas sp. wu1-DMT]|uniref:hypothetical protein n=1 Tax=Comamonas sp. wu1-DMT TaxID=3126390 RepID=UPI0032E51FD8
MEKGVIYDVVPQEGNWGAIGYFLDGKYFTPWNGGERLSGEVVGGEFKGTDGASGKVTGLVLIRDNPDVSLPMNTFHLVPRE